MNGTSQENNHKIYTPGNFWNVGVLLCLLLYSVFVWVWVTAPAFISVAYVAFVNKEEFGNLANHQCYVWRAPESLSLCLFKISK